MGIMPRQPDEGQALNSEFLLRDAQRHIDGAHVMLQGADQLEAVALQLMHVQRHWSADDHSTQLDSALAASRQVWQEIQTALAEGSLNLPLEVQQNLLILSVYADGKISECEAQPQTESLGSLIALTRTLAGSLKGWRAAA